MPRLVFAWRPGAWVRRSAQRSSPLPGFFVDLPLVRSRQPNFFVFCLKKKANFLVNSDCEKTILYSGSLGSGVDEERSKLRVGM